MYIVNLNPWSVSGGAIGVQDRKRKPPCLLCSLPRLARRALMLRFEFEHLDPIGEPLKQDLLAVDDAGPLRIRERRHHLRDGRGRDRRG